MGEVGIGYWVVLHGMGYGEVRVTPAFSFHSVIEVPEPEILHMGL